ncbi:EAL domain-containing protein [Domibacillus sp. PGB-M46]|uniref:EAL domain-containing protein n=1 Tax=Domibacillus sp. PGB-M46 TaxID=2910255 RepID=UPI001F5A071A|nr:EAL domain-containing protein [Domibacillus sp. PGB-M46]MCI2257190.1 EAL domain-containing protein [Domibacillus sp. PGB-M46]
MNVAKMLLFLFIYLFAFYTWLFISWENEWTRFLGANLLSLAGSAVSFAVLFKTYRVLSQKYRCFWLLLSISALFYFAGYSVCFYYQTILSVAMPYPGWADYMWLTAYFFALAAFLYAIILRGISVSVKPLFFNLVLFMVVVITLSLQYIVEPMFIEAGYTTTSTFVSIAYPLLDLCVLVAIMICYYLASSRYERILMVFCGTGFVVQLATDLIYVYWGGDSFADMGTFLDPLWQINLLLQGTAGLYAQKHLKEVKIDLSFYKTVNYSVLPYIGTMFLLTLIVYENYADMDILLKGCIIALLLIILRQFVIMKKNKQLMDEYKHLAYHDPLTGLGNRAKFKEDIGEICGHSSADNKAALLLIDLDRFKGINDTLGHQAGDCLLKELSEKLEGEITEKGTVYRIGGDEFLVLLPKIGSTSDALVIAEGILANSQQPLSVQGNEFVVTPSIGISIYPEHGQDTETLFRNADAAMYRAKEKGKNNYQVYNSALNDLLHERMQIEIGLRRAVEENGFTLYYQPKVDLYSKKIVGMEALIRWKHPEWGLVPPFKFISIAEETGQIISIGEWVLREACKQTKRWQVEGLPLIGVSVNVSVQQLEQNNFIQTVTDILKETNLSARFLELEITESVIQDLKRSTEILQDLREMGVRTSIDDFGTGYSSLSVIKTLPINVIKIDKSFIDDLDNPANQDLLKAIIWIGKSLGLQVIVEGVEEEQQMNMLLEYNCQFAQGYLFGKPMPREEFGKLLSGQQRDI